MYIDKNAYTDASNSLAYGGTDDFDDCSAPCVACPVGYFSEPSKYKDGCTPCQAGKYGNQIGQVFCKDCPKVLQKRKAELGLAQSVSLADTLSQRGSLNAKTAQGGKFDSNGEAETLRDSLLHCQDCPHGRYTGNPEGTPFEKLECDACPAGYFTITGQNVDSSKCQSCPVGKYNPAAGLDASSCKDCEVGKFNDWGAMIMPFNGKDCPNEPVLSIHSIPDSQDTLSKRIATCKDLCKSNLECKGVSVDSEEKTCTLRVSTCGNMGISGPILFFTRTQTIACKSCFAGLYQDDTGMHR